MLNKVNVKIKENAVIFLRKWLTNGATINNVITIITMGQWLCDILLVR